MVIKARPLRALSRPQQLVLTRWMQAFPVRIARGRRGKPNFSGTRTPTTKRYGGTLPSCGALTRPFVLQKVLPWLHFCLPSAFCSPRTMWTALALLPLSVPRRWTRVSRREWSS